MADRLRDDKAIDASLLPFWRQNATKLATMLRFMADETGGMPLLGSMNDLIAHLYPPIRSN
jgi:hypothetical protein